MTDPDKISSVGANNFGNTTNFLNQVVTQSQQVNQKSNFAFQQPQLATATSSSVSEARSKLDFTQTNNLNEKSFALQQHLNDLLHKQSLSSGSIQSAHQILPTNRRLGQEATSSDPNQQHSQTLDKNPKLHWPSTRSAVKTKKKTRQTNLIPTLLIVTLLVTVATLGYISYYLYNQNQSLQKQVYAQSDNPKPDVRLQKLIQAYEQEIANLQQKLNSLEQCNNQTTNST